MSSFGFTEILVILAIVVLLLGGKKLAKAGQFLGTTVRKLKGAWQAKYEGTDWERALGRRLEAAVKKRFKCVNDPELRDLACKLARRSGLSLPLTAWVITDDHQANAFVLPGGFLFVTSALRKRVIENEGELAGVIAHEIAHIACGHSIRKIIRLVMLDLGLSIFGVGKWPAYAAKAFARPKFSRDFEREADRLAIGYLRNAGYDPLALAQFFEKLKALQREKPGLISDFFQSHPSSDERIEAIHSYISDLPPH